MSLGMTFLRETFNNWTPTYLVQGVGLSKGRRPGLSGLFPFFGGVSVHRWRGSSATASAAAAAPRSSWSG